MNFARHLGKVARVLIFEASLWHVLLLRALIEGSSGRCLQIWTHPVSIMMSSSLGAQLNGILLKVKGRDYHEIYEIAFTYGLYEMTWEELYNTLNAKSSDGLITRHSFSEFFTEKGSRSSFGVNSYKKILGIFDCFDRTGSDFCDVDELTCGLSLFIRG